METAHSLCHSFYHLVNLEQEKGPVSLSWIGTEERIQTQQRGDYYWPLVSYFLYLVSS